MSNSNVDDIRRHTLDSVDAAEKNLRRAVALAGVVEGALLVTFFVVMDFGDRLHWLLLISAVLVYATLSAGLFALGAYIKLNTARVVRAIELTAPTDT